MADFKIKRGLQLDYDGMLTKDADTMYVCTDTGNMYLGSQRLCYFIPDWDASQGSDGYIDHRPFYSKNQTTLQSTVLGASQVDFDWDIAPILGAIYTVTISVGGVSTSYLLKVVGGPSQTTLKIDIPQYGLLLYDSASGFSNYNGRFSGNATVESVEISGEVIYPLDGKYVPDKVSKTGDTMTGDLTLSQGVKLKLPSASGDPKDFYIENVGGGIVHFYSMNADGTGTPYSVMQWRNGSVYLREAYIGGQQSKNIALNYDRANYPLINSSVTLVGGITYLNELGTIDYTTIALPNTPGTAEYNGSFHADPTESGGDITQVSGLSQITYWSGDTTIVPGKHYTFSFQNGIAFIIQLD